MNDLNIMNNFYKEYTKNKSEEELRSRILNFLINETSDDYKDDEIIDDWRKNKNKPKEKEFINLGFNGVINALLLNLCSTDIEKYTSIKEEIIKLIENESVKDIEKVLYFELRFYNKLDQERLIDDLIDCYIETRCYDIDVNINKKVEEELFKFYGDENSRLNDAVKWIDNSEYKKLF